ncbi:uncharacterized protein LOC133792130 [Humulus lupulus]|uniref:uncharacterized protein LOC133792130 n=1 Tax=Humulus lupulus TaxID=3486 RepID=UPI002B409851|nr:uncharacterized protein LOC133792130 [Humulus lupulus]
MQIASQEDPSCKIWMQIWKSKIHERHKIMWWQILMDALPCKAKVARFLHMANSKCTLCNHEEKNTLHFLWSCPVSARLWFLYCWGITAERVRISSWKEWFQVLGNDSNRPPTSSFNDLMQRAATIVSVIWRERNSIAHGAPVVPFDILCGLVGRPIQEWDASVELDQNRRWSNPTLG